MAGVNQVFSLADDFARTLATKADDAAEVIGKKIKPPKFSGLRFATKPIGDTVELSSMADVFTKSPINPSKSNIYSYIDDGILAFDGDQISVGLRDEMRERILSQAGLNDKNLALDIMDDINKKSPQLIEKSKYYSLGTAKLNKKTGEYIYLCENLKDMPDLNGLRGKTPLSNKGKGLIFRLKKIKESGIKTVIDLRSSGECSQVAKQALKDLELNYVNFPIEDCHWTTSSLEDITRFLHATRSGDFYVGCANGQARTDLAVAINYILNPDSKTLPKLYFGSTSATRISIKENFNDILKVIDKKPDIISDWGWNNYPEFKQEVTKRLEKLISSLSCG